MREGETDRPEGIAERPRETLPERLRGERDEVEGARLDPPLDPLLLDRERLDLPAVGTRERLRGAKLPERRDVVEEEADEEERRAGADGTTLALDDGRLDGGVETRERLRGVNPRERLEGVEEAPRRAEEAPLGVEGALLAVLAVGVAERVVLRVPPGAADTRERLRGAKLP
jgi:hypothetical protein